MLRGYRLFVLTIGLILAAASPPKNGDGQQPKQSAQPKVEQSLADMAATLREANKPSGLEKPCGEGEDSRESDLCAQWKAADAAKSSARAAWLFGALGTLIGGLTLAAASAAAVFAKKAADHTESGAKAAADAVSETREANRISQEAMYQQRPWLKIVEIRIRDISFLNNPDRPDIGDHFSVHISVKVENVGQIPAMEVQCIGAIWLNENTEVNFEDWRTHWDAARNHAEQRYTNGSRFGQVLFPGDDSVFSNGFSTSIYMPPRSLPVSRECPDSFRIFVQAVIFYRFNGKVAWTMAIKVIDGGKISDWIADPIRKGSAIASNRLGGAETAT